MDKISNYYISLQQNKNLSIKGATTRHIKFRLQNIFGNKLTFYCKKEGLPEYVYSIDSPVEQDERSWFLLSDVEKVSKVANLIRSQIDLLNCPFSSWPPPSDEIVNSNVVIPELLNVFLKALFNKQLSISSSRVTRLVTSIGQDMIYSSTRGKSKTVKHVQLGIITKRKTGSKFLINCLNRLGHSISYDEVNNIETSFAEKQFMYQNYQAFVPNNVQSSIFVTFVYDNCDHNPESLTGISMHCTNGIIIQRPAVAIELTQTHAPELNVGVPRRRRSFAAVTTELAPYYQPAERSHPAVYNEIEQYQRKISENDLGPMTLYWQSFIDMVQILLDYIKSVRCGDWDLHLQSTERMLKWFHAYDHTNYARHFTYNWASQQKLMEKTPRYTSRVSEWQLFS